MQLVELFFAFLLQLSFCLLNFLLLVLIAKVLVFPDLFNFLFLELVHLLFDFRGFSTQVRNYKKLITLFFFGDKITAFLRHLYRFLLHIYRVVEVFVNDREILGIISQIETLRLLYQTLILCFLHQFSKLLIFWETPFSPIESETGFVILSLFM